MVCPIYVIIVATVAYRSCKIAKCPIRIPASIASMPHTRRSISTTTDTFAIICCWRTICVQLTLIKFECNNYIQEEKSHLLATAIQFDLNIPPIQHCVSIDIIVLFFYLDFIFACEIRQFNTIINKTSIAR